MCRIRDKICVRGNSLLDVSALLSVVTVERRPVIDVQK